MIYHFKVEYNWYQEADAGVGGGTQNGHNLAQTAEYKGKAVYTNYYWKCTQKVLLKRELLPIFKQQLLKRVFRWENTEGTSKHNHEKHAYLAHFNNCETIFVALQYILLLHKFFNIRMIGKCDIAKEAAHDI